MSALGSYSDNAVDGDTIEVDEERIRLWRIDAPEVAQFCTEDGARYPCGLDASQALRKRIGRQADAMTDVSPTGC